MNKFVLITIMANASNKSIDVKDENLCLEDIHVIAHLNCLVLRHLKIVPSSNHSYEKKMFETINLNRFGL